MNLGRISTHFQRLPRQPRVLVFTAIMGVCGGGAAVLFHLAIHGLYNSTFGQLGELGGWKFLLGSFVVIISASALVGYLLNKVCPAASGSGIPQVKLAFWKEFGYMPWKVVWVKFLAGVASVGGGCSLGREGPSVQLASGLTSNLAGWLGEPKQGRRLAAASGAAAGLAAAFNTPLAAVTFVLEEIITDLNSRFLGGVLLASVIGALVAHAFVGKQPAFTLSILQTPTWTAYLCVPVVAAMAALLGVLFHKATLRLRARRKGFSKVPVWTRPILGGLVTWGVGCAVFFATGRLGVFGLGYHDLSEGLNNQLGWRLAAVLLAGKIVATVACYGFGGCGGIFSPTLFLGGMCGIVFGGLGNQIFGLTASDQTMLAVVGMSACLGAVVRAPMTGILIVFEMTHDFALVPALMVTALISHALSGRLVPHNFYEAILEQDGHNLDHLIPPRDLRTWQQLPVSAIANFQPITLSSLDASTLREHLRRYPYQVFPVVEQGRPLGMLRRQEAESALAEGREPQLEPAVTSPPGHSVRRLQHLLIESPTGMVLIKEPASERMMGLITLHDLLRAEVAMAETAEG